MGSYVGTCGSNSSKSSASTLAWVTTVDVAAGDLLVAFIGFDNASSTTPTVSSISKPVGETASWVKLTSHDSTSATGAASVRGEIWAIRPNATFPNATSVTVTLSAAVAIRTVAAAVFTGYGTTLRGSATSISGTDVSSLSLGTATNPAVGDLVLVQCTAETSSIPTGDTDTTDGLWADAASVGTTGGSGTSNVVTLGQYKITTGATAQNWQASAATVTDGGIAMAVLQPVATNVTGTATAPVAFSAPVAGTVQRTGTATGSFSFAAPAAAAVSSPEVDGTASAALAFTAPATGGVEHPGTATGPFTFTAPASGMPTKAGAATGSFGFAASATGLRTVTATELADIAFSAPASGAVLGTVVGTATGGSTFTAPAAAVRQVPGAAGAALGFDAVASAAVSTPGGVIYRPDTGTTARPGSGTNVRPSTATTARPDSGSTSRPLAGVTARP